MSEPFLIVKRAQAELAIKSYPDNLTLEVSEELSRMKRELV